MKKYYKYIVPYLPFFILGPLMMLTEVFGEIWIPTLMSRIIDIGVTGRDIPYIMEVGATMIGACLIMIVGGTFGGYFAARASVSFTADLRQDLFKKVQDFSFADIDEFSTGSLITRLTNDLQQVQNLITQMLKSFLRSPGMLVGGFIMAMGLNKQLALMLLLVIPLLGGSIFVLMFTAYPLFIKMQTALDNLNNGIKETLTNVRVVKSFVREDFECEKFEVLNEELRVKSLRALNIMIITMPIMNVFMNATSCAVVWFGGNRVILGEMQVGDLTAFITYVTQILMSLMMLAMIILQSSRSMASFKRISEIMNFEPELNDLKGRERDKKVESGSIEFRHVYFAYKKIDISANEDARRDGTPGDGDIHMGAEEAYVLKDISFRIDPGETVGILGATGSGKTSLVQLIPRLYDVSEGEVLVDGTDVRDYSFKNLRDGVAMVLQYNTLFAGSVSENLRWGDAGATDEEVRRAASFAQADAFISAFDGGYDYMIEQGGTNVSGGQKQRLCIARALLKNPKILILDDSTSAVDTATERHIEEAFAGALRGITRLIIAQRVGSVRDADRIIVLDNGQIVDIGSHDELIARCGEYQEIYYSQIDKAEETA